MLQRSEEWFAERCGRITASSFADILAKGEGKTRKARLWRVAAERLSGVPMESFSNVHTLRGTADEPKSAAAYTWKTGNALTEVGFIPHETLMTGCSPDSLIGMDGGYEAKNVIPTVQLETIDRGGYPPAHKAQIQGCLWICERDWWDFCSHSESLPEPFKTYIFRVHRDEEYIKTLESEVIRALDEVETIINNLRAKCG